MIKINCKYCGRYLFEAVASTAIQGLICPNSKCKAKLNIKVLFATDCTDKIKQLVFTEDEKPPRTHDSTSE